MLTLERLRWPELDAQQRIMLSAREFQDRASLLLFQRESVDYQQLLQHLEKLETDPISRVRPELAGSIHWLSLSAEENQTDLARTLQQHYRMPICD